MSAVPLIALCAWTVACPSASSVEPPSRYAPIADQLVEAVEPTWDQRAGRYAPGGGGATTIVNANLLVVYSVAAQRGLSGRSRNDARARSIVRFLTRPPIWQAKAPAALRPKVRGPGWLDGTGRSSLRHPVHDSEAAEALAQA